MLVPISRLCRKTGKSRSFVWPRYAFLATESGLEDLYNKGPFAFYARTSVLIICQKSAMPRT